MQDAYYPEIDRISLIMKETFYGITPVPKKYHLYKFLKINDVIEESQYSTKILFLHSHEEIFLGYSSPMGIRKYPQCCTIKSRRRQTLSTHTISNTEATIKKNFT